MPDSTTLTLECAIHGRSGTAVVCCHLVARSGRLLGFFENSDDPQALQAWCGDCEALFLQERELTETFRAFNDFKVICVACYQDLKARHSPMHA